MPARQPLSHDEMSRYESEGFVIPNYRLPAADLAEMQASVARVVADNPQYRNRAIAAAHVPPHEGSDVVTDAALGRFLTHPALLGIAQQLDGPDLLVWTTTVFHKDAGIGPATPWHQDATYWPIRPLATTSIWIAVTDCKVDNGCLRVVPGSHHELAAHSPVSDDPMGFNRIVADAEDAERRAVDVELEAGQIVLLAPAILHASRPNQGRRPRTGFVIRYMPTTSVFDHDGRIKDDGAPPSVDTLPGYTTRPLVLVSGVDRSGRNDFSRNRPPPCDEVQ